MNNKLVLIGVVFCILLLFGSLALAAQSKNQNSDNESEDDDSEDIENEQNCDDNESCSENEIEEASLENSISNGEKEKKHMGNEEVETELEIENETIKNETKYKVKMSNGKNSEIKIMPSTASETALERLRLKVCSLENNCTIVLKEVGQGNETELRYEIKAEKEYKILWLFKSKGEVKAEISAENGEIISESKPWWKFIAKEVE